MKYVSLLFPFVLLISQCQGQDSASFSRQIEVIDSLAARIENDRALVQTNFITGPTAESACSGGAFKGTAWRNTRSNTIDKMLLINDSTGERTICYCLLNRLSKIVVNKIAYYHLGDQYYNEYGSQGISPVLFRQFLKDEDCLKMAIVIAK
jgi:hypothetical protein